MPCRPCMPCMIWWMCMPCNKCNNGCQTPPGNQRKLLKLQYTNPPKLLKYSNITTIAPGQTTPLPPPVLPPNRCTNGAPDHTFPFCCHNGAANDWCCPNGANNPDCILSMPPARRETINHDVAFPWREVGRDPWRQFGLGLH